jgi:hypothetical protein
MILILVLFSRIFHIIPYQTLLFPYARPDSHDSFVTRFCILISCKYRSNERRLVYHTAVWIMLLYRTRCLGETYFSSALPPPPH